MDCAFFDSLALLHDTILLSALPSKSRPQLSTQLTEDGDNIRLAQINPYAFFIATD
jgi:hypothetical protein